MEEVRANIRHFWPLIIKQYAKSARVKATDKKDSLSP